ncbi:MAG TPA: glycoside hydrolase family 43 protein [Intrasporangium sp.]|uniref:glycoside hydrolase family 43 protein n=1 Tax=Intrasporangium sp. TaxID=1925024 RepID=UPI002D776E08|nr:glycoside hydrolase family 43 protein [Intrasporangium sp.]HET7397085.1 glycoside hydrolase family 43 protein [Intrasporangium sp.]
MPQQRPLWDGYCADPFVIRAQDGRFVMYGTSPERPGGRAFQTLVSDDLDVWCPAGGALVIPADAPAGTEWWAPEVAYAGGRYWMYYSQGMGDQGHQIRVASSVEPTGPFTEAGPPLTEDLPFAIDPSPFQDVDGTWWLFYATDLVEGARPGTVIAVQRLRTMTELAGEPRIILRASADWQLYARDRQLYGAQHDWHTLEGPAVVRHGDRYWLLYSGGNWQTPRYGVAAASAASVEGQWTEDAAIGPFITSQSTGLIGPGHCSIVSAVGGGHHLFLHAWDAQRQRRRPHRLTLQITGGPPRVAP